MNLSYFIAKRYLFSKKSHNAINIMSTISVCGIALATMAMVCVLSVFNGFGGFFETLYSAFDPDVKITVKNGKVFDYHTPQFDAALQLDGIQWVSETLEENALYKFEDRQAPVLIKGVSEEFRLMTDMDRLLLDGSFKLSEDVVNYTTLGAGVAITLGARAGFVNPIEIYAPKRDAGVNLANPAAAFTSRNVFIGGVFSLNQPEVDNQVAIVPIALARDLFDYPTEVTSLDIKLKSDASLKRVKASIKELIGSDFMVEDRHEQQKASFRMLQIEKWVTFLIMGFILLIAVFNLVGSLSMLIVEKESDIVSLQNLGADNRLISRIFLYEGWLIALVGILVGIGVGLALCLLQQHFGLLQLSNTPGAYAMDAYPVVVKFWDIVVVFGVVSLISFLTILQPINSLKKNLTQKKDKK